MTGARTLVLLRHGRTAWNEVGRAQGHADVELDEVGHAQASTVAPYMAALEPAALWTSDLARARQTCAYVEEATGLSAKEDPRLREFDVGARQGLTMPEFFEAFPDAAATWSAGHGMPQLEGAESTVDVAERLLPALLECFAALAPGEAGVVVTHGASLKVGLAGLLGWPEQLSTTFQGLENCGWAVLTEVEPGGRVRLVAYNRQAGPSGGGLTDL
ncbi:MAG: histidine phosphatase family protein [Nocardioidaceae bacterium]